MQKLPDEATKKLAKSLVAVICCGYEPGPREWAEGGQKVGRRWAEGVLAAAERKSTWRLIPRASRANGGAKAKLTPVSNASVTA